MKGRRFLLCQVIGLVLSIVLLAGCESSQQPETSWQQEKLKLQETIEAQQAEIDKLKRFEETMLDMLSDISHELIECQKQLKKNEVEKEIIKKSKQLTPEELKKGLAEIKALRQAAAKRRMKEKAAAETGKSQDESK